MCHLTKLDLLQLIINKKNSIYIRTTCFSNILCSNKQQLSYWLAYRHTICWDHPTNLYFTHFLLHTTGAFGLCSCNTNYIQWWIKGSLNHRETLNISCSNLILAAWRCVIKEEANPMLCFGWCLETPGTTGPDTNIKLLCNKQVTRALVQFHSQEQFASLKPFHTLLLFLGRLLILVWNRLTKS